MPNKPKNGAIIPAGGAGLRMGLAMPKQFAQLGGRTILAHTLLAFERTEAIDCIILVVPADYCDEARNVVAGLGLQKVTKILAGGGLRMDSVHIGLEALADDVEVVAVHDGVRPLISSGLIDDCLRAARETGAAIAAIPVKDTVKAIGPDKMIDKTVDRQGLWLAQTPQAARVELLKKAYAVAAATGFAGTDEASLLENAGIPVMIVEGSEKNIKITRPEDLWVAEALMGSNVKGTAMRIGHGYDAHRLVTGRKLVLGGVRVPHEFGLLGHSDADVLVHALCDALLGALGEGDIGRHFPDTDPAFKGISSLLLLEKVMEMVGRSGFELMNCDVTVVAQQPKLAPYMPAMRGNISRICGVALAQVNIKATTTEQMGFAGRGEGMAAHAVVLLAMRPGI